MSRLTVGVSDVRGGARSLGERARALARRGISPFRPTPRPGPSRQAATGGEPSLQRQGDRLAEALAVVETIEAREPSLPSAGRPREFLTLDRVVRRPDIGDHLQPMLPAALQGDWDPALSSVARVRAPVGADVVVLAKFDLSPHVKLRAAYGAARCTVAVQPDRPNGTSGITAAVRSHEIVDRYAAGLIPAMTAHGELGSGQRYLVEDLVPGVPLTTSLRMAEHLAHVLEGLDRIHRGYGLHTRRPSELWAHFPDQWRAVGETGLVPEEVAARVAALIEADRRLRVSWTHGDLVASNVLATGDGVAIIDWEHAAERQIMHDAAKLHQFTAGEEPLLELLLAEWGQRVAADGYVPAEELALQHARSLSHAPSRMAALAGHRREGLYARQVTRQVDLLTQTLERLD